MSVTAVVPSLSGSVSPGQPQRQQMQTPPYISCLKLVSSVSYAYRKHVRVVCVDHADSPSIPRLFAWRCSSSESCYLSAAGYPTVPCDNGAQPAVCALKTCNSTGLFDSDSVNRPHDDSEHADQAGCNRSKAKDAFKSHARTPHCHQQREAATAAARRAAHHIQVGQHAR